MRGSPVLLVVLLVVSGCLGSGAKPAAGPEPRGACDGPLLNRVRVPAGSGALPVGGYANLVAVGGGRIWTLVTPERGGRRVVVGIEPRTGAVSRWPYRGSHEARIRAGGGAVWLADPQSRTVTRFDEGRPHVRRLFERRGGPTEIAVGAGRLWAIPAEGGVVAELSLATGAVERRLSVHAAALADVAVAGGRVWLTTGDGGTLLVLGARTGRPLGRPIGLGAETLDVEASAERVWVDLGDADALAAVDAGTREVLLPRVPNGGDVFAIALGHGAVWATNYGRATVTRIDPATGDRSTEPTGADPKGIAAGEGAVWVADAGACTITRLAP